MALFCICYQQNEFVQQAGEGVEVEAGEVYPMQETYCEVILEFFLRATADLGHIYEESHSCSLDDAKCLKPNRKCVNSPALHF